MKKIMLITESFEKGVGRHILDLYKNLKSEDVKVYIVYGIQRCSDKFINQISMEDRIEVKNLKRKIGINDIKSYFEIKEIIKKIKPDIVHCHSSKAGFSGRVAAKRCKVNKIIYSPHAYFFLKFNTESIKRKIFVGIERFLSKYFTDITVTTSIGEDKAFEKNKIDKNSKKILIEHGIIENKISQSEIDIERKKYNIDDKDILVGAMARFENQKDPIGTFKIMRKLAKNNKNVKCIFFGNGSQYNEIQQLNKDNIVILPGETKKPDLSLKMMDIYLTASLYEGLPYTMIQALSQGLPIVASKVEGNEDCIEDGKNGYLFESKNYDEAVNKIEKIIKNYEFKKMSDNSLKIFNERFTLDSMIKKYSKLYLGD
jgi:glycosyltransferase involved in cell wall biosynthesis